MTIGYKILFKVNLLHEYYTDWKTSDFVIRPTAETEQVLKNHQMLYRQVEDGILVFASVEDVGGTSNMKVALPFDENLKMVFHAELRNPYFGNFTDIPMKFTPEISALSPFRRAYYFDNRNENIANPTIPPAVAPTAIKLLSSNASEVVAADGIAFLPSIFRLHFDSPVNTFELKVKDRAGTSLIFKNRDGDTVVPVTKTTVGAANAFDEVEVDLSQVPAGRYTLNFDPGSGDQDFEVYIGDEAYRAGPFGLIEIFHETAVAISYRFLDGNILPNDGGTPKTYTPPEYFIWFKNRATTWRYIFPSTPAPLNAPTDFSPVNDNYESDNPKLLTEAYQSVQDQAGTKFPNPDPKNVIPDSSSPTTFYSDIYLYP